jgi:hypothetical protein
MIPECYGLAPSAGPAKSSARFREPADSHSCGGLLKKTGQARSSAGTQIVEAYKNYLSPFDAAKTVRLLPRYVPPQYVAGLKTIVLTNQQAMSHDQRRRKLWSRRRKVPMTRVRDRYFQAWKGNPAWFELFVDKTSGWQRYKFERARGEGGRYQNTPGERSKQRPCRNPLGHARGWS